MESWILYITIGVPLGLIIGFHVLSWCLDRHIESLEKQVRTILRDKIVLVQIDQNEGQYLCYNYMNNEYVCQGRDAQEIATNFRLRYPTRRAVIVVNEKDASSLRDLAQQINKHYANQAT